MLVGTVTEVTNSLSGVSFATEQDSVGTGGASQGELVQGEAFTASSQDAGTGSGSETESGNRQFGDFNESNIVRYSGDDDDSFARCVLDSAGNTRDRHWRTVDLAHVESAKDDFVEAAVSSTGQEAVELDQKQEVGVLRLGGGSVSFPDMMFDDIDTHRDESRRLE